MKRFIIIVSVYDQENTQAYPLGGVFESEYDACKYLNANLDEVKDDHWTKNRMLDDGAYHEERSMNGSFYAKDLSDGRFLEIVIHELPVMSNEFPVIAVTRDDLENRGFKAADLNDDTMDVIASKMSDYMLDECDFWTALDASCEWHEIPRKGQEPTIIKADTAGRIVMFGEPADDDIYYVGAAYGDNDGIVYKDKHAFDEHDGICYVPEAYFFKADEIADLCSDDMKAFIEEDHCGYVCNDSGGYTRDDLYAEMYDRMDCNDWVERMEKDYGKAFVEEFIDKETAYVFQELDWQCPSTFMDELDWEEDWKQYLKEKFDDPRLTNKQKEELYD